MNRPVAELSAMGPKSGISKGRVRSDSPEAYIQYPAHPVLSRHEIKTGKNDLRDYQHSGPLPTVDLRFETWIAVATFGTLVMRPGGKDEGFNDHRRVCGLLFADSSWQSCTSAFFWDTKDHGISEYLTALVE